MGLGRHPHGMRQRFHGPGNLAVHVRVTATSPIILSIDAMLKGQPASASAETTSIYTCHNGGHEPRPGPIQAETQIPSADPAHDPAYITEKVRYSEQNDELKSEVSGDEDVTDLFVPFPEVKGLEPEGNPLTVRAVLVGIILGSLVNASNVYLGKSYLPASSVDAFALWAIVGTLVPSSQLVIYHVS
ncbi:OPT oligopeptide transporter [Colletotrichum tofieldiae]|nr:OPT oligopeptide transporter [Colletotrichum tofieldiae]